MDERDIGEPDSHGEPRGRYCRCGRLMEKWQRMRDLEGFSASFQPPSSRVTWRCECGGQEERVYHGQLKTPGLFRSRRRMA